MKRYVKVDDNGDILSNEVLSAISVAKIEGAEYSNDYTPPANYEIYVDPTSPDTITKYSILSYSAVKKINGVWTKEVTASEGSEDYKKRVDTTLTINARKVRDKLLSSSDWTQLPDAPLTEEKKQEWSVYRKQLRDLTTDSKFPVYHSWPTRPE